MTEPCSDCGIKPAGSSCPLEYTPCGEACIFSDALERIEVGVLLVQRHQRRVLYKNPAACRALDLDSDDDYAGVEPLLELASPADPPKRLALQVGRRMIGYTAYRTTPSITLIFLSDITEKMRLESIAEAVNVMDSIGYVFAGIRHELGNPLNSIKMAVSVLRKNLDSFSPATTADYFERIMGEIGRVEFLLSSLRNYSLFEKPAIRDVPISSFLDSFRKLVEADLGMRGIRLEVCAGRDGVARADPRALQQVLLNVVTNASNALERRPDPKVVISVAGRRGRVEIVVEDNGTGIPERDLAQVFQPFFTTKAAGTGLGLAIVRDRKSVV